MSMRLGVAAIAITLVVVTLTVRSSAQTPGARRFVAGEVLVKFRPGVNANAQADAHRVARGLADGEVARTRVQRVRVPAGEELDAVARYLRNPNVVLAEPNHIRSIPAPLAHGDGTEVVPGDFYFHEQWALDNTGQGFYCVPFLSTELCLASGTPDADIDAPEAWALFEGNSNVTVAVIDSGVDYNHPDLAANYAGGDDFVFADGDPMDDNGHGTHVAGTIAAAMGNLTGTPSRAEGVVGVAPHARIRAYKVCRADGTCDDFAIQQAIARAITDGANIINMSLGDPTYSQSLDDAVQDAWNAGLVIVAGAGNDGTSAPFYPAAFDNVISVAAFDENHERASFSNFGNWVDIAAPGTVIMSTYRMAACSNSTTAGDTGCYTWNSGTSMSTPHVAGAAALVWSRSDVTSNSQVVDILLSSADGRGAAPGRLDSWTLHGGLNLHNAVSYGLENLPPSANAGADQMVADNNSDGVELVTLNGAASSDGDGNIASHEWREGTTSIGTGATVDVWLPVGVHTVTLDVTDDEGAHDTDTVVVTVTPANQVTVAASTPQAAEAGSVPGVFTITRSGDNSAPLTVRYTVAGTALAGADYVSLPGSLTIEAQSSTATISVVPIDDGAYESNETITLTLGADAAYTIGSPGGGTVTLISDDLPPDLVMSAVTAPATAGADADIVVSDTTRNQGTGQALASTTGLYLSTNTALDAADVRLGSRQVATLGPGATDTGSTTLRIPASTTAGTYYVLAKADWDNAVLESGESNNTRVTSSVRIGPDVIVSAVTAPAVGAPGGAISISDTTKNQGAGDAEPSTTRLYLSTNTSLDASDVALGTRSVPLLAGGASANATTSVTLPTTTATGTYYILAAADAANTVVESIETNNTRNSSLIRVGSDLVVTVLTAPALGAAGASITVVDSTTNQGAAGAPVSSTGFYLSPNSSFDASDTFLGSRPVAELAGGATSSATTALLIPADVAGGTYYVIAVADWNGTVIETAETNNLRTDAMPIGGDLVVASLTVSGGGAANGPMTVTDTTKNQGASIPQSETAFYFSSNSTFDAGDIFLASRGVPSLGTSAVSTATTQLTVPAGTSAGTYWVIGVADWRAVITESAETNNTRSDSIRVGPDLIVSAVSAPSSTVAGATISATDTTRNQGGDTAPVSVTSYYLSANSALDAGDLLLSKRTVPSLAAGISQAGSISLAIPASTAAGTYYIIAKGDGDDLVLEPLENNNTRARTISISATSP